MSKATHIICILDRSTSMAGMANEVIRNFNNFLEEQQSLEGKAKLTLALFDSGYKLVYDEIDLKKAKPLTNEVYSCQGMTAMNDAVGRTLTNKSRKKKAIVLIHTDGMENASREYRADDVKKLVKKLKKKWEFIFVGANIDAQKTNKSYGFTHTLQSNQNDFGYDNSYNLFNTVSTCYRSTGVVNSAATVAAVAEANAAEGSSSANAVVDKNGLPLDANGNPIININNVVKG